ncbi:MAG: hypothetical protein JOZ49_05995 [Mycolicibacterium sp.]|nr:hypothetical protein [Mycolicibacterium sp.]
MAETATASGATPVVIQDAVSDTISRDRKLRRSNSSSDNKHTNADRYFRGEVAYLKDRAA